MPRMRKKRVYLDVCALCRPFDDQRMMRIRLETDALYLILRGVEQGTYQMVVSPVHLKEVEGIDDAQERFDVVLLMDKYGMKPRCNWPRTRRRAEHLCSLGFGVADAAHVAVAEVAADFFVTCDDTLVKKCARAAVSVQVMNPVDFCVREDLR